MTHNYLKKSGIATNLICASKTSITKMLIKICENNFVWALESFKSLLCKLDELSKVIVIDRDLALMNVVRI